MPDRMSPQAAEALMPALRGAVREAAAIALPFFVPGGQTRARVWSKSGGSPVTEADVEVDAFLKVRLSELVPEAAWLSEETRDDPVRLKHDLVWIVDPIDGTRAFLTGHVDWSIAVALLSKGEPVIGIVDAPACGRSYEAVAGLGALRDGSPIRVSDRTELAGARVTGPKPMFDALARGISSGRDDAGFERIERVPSLALRVARVAEGSIDVGLVSKDARDWDLAAADLILREAGGRVCDLSGRPTPYNRPDPVHGELIAASHTLAEKAVAALRNGPADRRG